MRDLLRFAVSRFRWATGVLPHCELCGKTAVPLVDRYPNLMVLRTFSKWAGLAGLRVGYGIFSPEIASYLIKIKLPYNVNVAALVAVSPPSSESGRYPGPRCPVSRSAAGTAPARPAPIRTRRQHPLAA